MCRLCADYVPIACRLCPSDAPSVFLCCTPAMSPSCAVPLAWEDKNPCLPKAFILGFQVTLGGEQHQAWYSCCRFGEILVSQPCSDGVPMVSQWCADSGDVDLFEQYDDLDFSTEISLKNYHALQDVGDFVGELARWLQLLPQISSSA